jgi:hypothetical protein
MTTQSKDRDYDLLAAACRSWWQQLQGGDGENRDRKSLAELRRVGVVEENGAPVIDVAGAMGVSMFRALQARVRHTKLSERTKRILEASGYQPLVVAAATIARIREDATPAKERSRRGETARLLGASRDGSRDGEPLLAEPRFKRLMRSRDDGPDLLIQGRRIGAILERAAPIGDLAASVVLWNVDATIRRDWAFAYYQRTFEPVDDDGTAVPATTSASP